jgi:CheY-like chemotaxis protein
MESIGRLAGGVAHDFNNMLQAILGYTQLAQQQTPPDGPLCDSLRHIEAVTRKAAEMTRKLLAFARRQPMQPRVLNLNGVIAGQLDLLRRLIGENIVLDWRPSADPWFVRMDPSQVDQILTNLAVNARDAIEGAGRIAVATANVTLDAAFAALHPGSRPGEYVELSVNDTGRGIPAEVLAHLFEPFYTTKSRGSGLGLATVYGIVKQNNGMIYGESEPGRGATFRVYFPRQTAEAPSAPSRIEVSDAAAPPPTGSETLLLVEDEEVVRHQTQALLARLGYVVLAAAASDEALRLMQLNAGMIDLLVSDVVMPEMNGRDLARRLTVVQPGLKCLFVSGYSDDVIAHHGVLDKDVHFLAKPFDMAALARKVREVLDG